ncbi:MULTISPECIES: hypothetical protein [Cupriavidus]|uniref:hypothetical protein n=1 Tax=Cupriavidus TaxID=106589 RepID=UPI0025A8DB0C|nr:hypothetical protein [Cupriavidus sp. TKC]GMG91449.1 hypothetical protein Cmtc_26690 [Cupriavidus sp. TKC]
MNRYQNPEMSGGAGVAAASTSALTALRSLYSLMPLLLALLATLTSLGTAALSGWERGGAMPEQFGNIALAVAAVLAMHLLLALCRTKPLAVRCSAALMWAVSFAVVLYGQMTFFLLAQQHAGDRRAQAVPEVTAIDRVAALPMRSLTAISQDQEKVRTMLAANNARHCDRDCLTQRMRREVLTAKLDALTTEADEVRRHQAKDDRLAVLDDRATRLRDSLHEDPVTARLSALIGLDEQKLNLLLALACAAVLDCMGSLCWWLAFDGSRAVVTTGVTSVVAPDDPSHRDLVSSRREATTDADVPVANEYDGRLVQLIRDVAAGKLRPTVDGIRRYFSCAQGKANQLCREYHALRLALQSETAQG